MWTRILALSALLALAFSCHAQQGQSSQSAEEKASVSLDGREDSARSAQGGEPYKTHRTFDRRWEKEIRLRLRDVPWSRW